MRSLYEREGVRFLYKGINASVLRNATFVTSKMFVYNSLKQEYKLNSFREKMLSGFVAGGIGTIVGSPFDLILVNMQSNPAKYTSISKTAFITLKNEGIFGFYKGFQYTLSRAVVVTSSQFAVFEQIKQSIQSENKLAAFFISSVSSSVITSVVSNPIDVCKTRTMNNIQPNTIMSIIKEESIHGLWKGVEMNLCRQIPLNIIRFGLFELYSNAFSRI